MRDLNFQLAGKRACRFPGNPPHGRVAPVKFLYEIGDRIVVQGRRSVRDGFWTSFLNFEVENHLLDATQPVNVIAPQPLSRIHKLSHTPEISNTVPQRVPQPVEGAAAAVSGERPVVRPRPKVHQLRQQFCADALTDYRCWMR